MLDRHHLNYRVIVLWALSLLVGAVFFFFLVGVPLAFASLNTGWLLIVVVSVIGLIGGAVTGLVIGLIQRAILPKSAPWKRLWILGCILGWAVGGAVGCLIIGLLQLAFFEYPKQGVDENIGILLGPITAVLAGTSVGAVQALFIQSGRPGSRFWVIATACGWILGGLIWAALVFLGPMAREQGIYDFLFIPVVVGIAGLVTGYSMNVLLSWSEGNN